MPSLSPKLPGARLARDQPLGPHGQHSVQWREDKVGYSVVGELGRKDAGPYLLTLLHTQLPADLDALDGVDEEVP